MTFAEAPEQYPVQFQVDYPERQSRWKALLRIPLAVPALLFAGIAFYVTLLALFPMWLAILVRGRIPRWLFDFQVGAIRFNLRVQSYLSMLSDVYPAFDGEYPARYEVSYPERVSRRKLVFWKFVTSLPHWIVVSVLQYAAFALVAVGWIAIIFSGRFPKGLHEFVVGVMRWRERVYAYSLSLTDEFPPFSLAADATAARGKAYVASAGFGLLVAGGLIAGLVALVVTTPFGGESRVVEVSYARLVDGELAPGETFVKVGSVGVELVGALDPADDAASFFGPRPGHRLVLFSFRLTNLNSFRNEDANIYVSGNDFHLSAARDDSREPLIAVIGRRAPPVLIEPLQTVAADVVFEVPVGSRPSEVSFDRSSLFSSNNVHYRFR